MFQRFRWHNLNVAIILTWSVIEKNYASDLVILLIFDLYLCILFCTVLMYFILISTYVVYFDSNGNDLTYYIKFKYVPGTNQY